MPEKSAGILLFRRKKPGTEFFLVHPGGPFWAKKDEHSWSIPKGISNDEEELLTAAIREMQEETGIITRGNFIALNPVKQKSGKIVYAWALEMDTDPTLVKSNSFEIEWPPRSGKLKSFPEIDRAGWFPMDSAAVKIIPGQLPLLLELETILSAS